MNSEQLRPPQPVYKVLAVLIVPAVIFWCGPFLARTLFTPLQAHYVKEYTKASFPSFGHKKRDRILLVEEPQLHAVTVPLANNEYREWLQEHVYDGLALMQFFRNTLIVTGFVWAGLFAIGIDLDRKRQLDFRARTRHIRGTRLMTRAEFNREVTGDGLGWRTEEYQDTVAGRDVKVGRTLRERISGNEFPMIRIPRSREAEHLAVCGSSGSGKTSVLMAIGDQAEREEATCIVYDPHPQQQFVRRYYDPTRGDVILHSVDERMPHWNPSHEVDYTTVETARMTALASAESLYPGQPGDRDWFFTDAARRMYQHCMVHYRPDAAQLVHLYEHMDPLIDAITKGTDLETMLTKNAGPQRAGIQSTASQCLPALRQVPPAGLDRLTWSARQWAQHRRGWVFLTSRAGTRVAMRPLHSLWLDSLIRNLIDAGTNADVPRVYIIIDEAQALQELPQLATVLRESRKSNVCVAIGFHAKADLKGKYRDEAETIISAPATKMLLRIGDPEAQEWASKMSGDHDIERLREHVDNKGKKSYTVDRTTERLIMATEFAGFEPRVGVLRHGNFTVKVKVRYVEPRPDRAEGFIQAPGRPAEILPLPSLEEIRKKEEEERMKEAQKMAVAVAMQQPLRSARRNVKPPKVVKQTDEANQL
jgi:ABC-type dipeptide/oligopeptide/nickel transport system ATPase component